MSRRLVRALLFVVVSLTAARARGQGFAVQRQEKLPGPADDAAPPPKPVRYVMTISGGISLGAYEAGFNWALLKHLKRSRAGSGPAASDLAPLELVAATGASAGNINAFLTAVGWCQTAAFDAQETPTNNLFWDAWVPIGLDELFLGPGGAYAKDDGLLARSAFAGIKKKLAAATANAGRFDAGCKLPIGITVTRNKLGSLVLNDSGGSGPGLQIATQRFVVTMQAQASPQGLDFVERARSCDDPAVGQYLHLPGPTGGKLPIDSVLGLVEASSAFPLAFGSKRVNHCAHGDKHDPLCALQTEVPEDDAFFDGGVFDNVPLGLGVSLAMPRKPRACPSDHDDGDIEFLYVDPARRRTGPFSGTDAGQAGEGPTRGLASVLTFLGNFIQVSRQYELQTAARYVFDRLFSEDLRRAAAPDAARMARGEQASRSVARLRLSSRFYPVVGNYLGAFGAFFAKSFREYDFYVGVYDALFGVAEAYCRTAGAGDPISQGRCIAAKVVDLETSLGVAAPGSEPARYVVNELLRAEMSAWLTDANATPALLASIPAVDARTPGLSVDSAGRIKVMAALVAASGEIERREAAVNASGDPVQKEKFFADDTFIAYVDRFHAHLGDMNAPGVRQQFAPREYRFVRDPDAEMRIALAAAAEREAEIEEQENYQLGTQAMAVAQMLLYSEPFRPSKGVDLDPSSIPDRRLTFGRAAARILPYSVSGDILNGGTSIEYRPGYWFVERVGVGVPLSPIVWQSGQGGRMLVAGGLALLLHLDSVLLPELQLGARFTQTWAGIENASLDVRPGAELAGYLLAGKLRLSVGVDDFAKIADTHHAWSIKLGLADLNGLVYWAFRFIGG
jgi:hypothetical protein